MDPEYVKEYENLERDHWWWISRRQILLATLKKLPLNRDQLPSLLDIGCGVGFGIVSLRNQFDCTGIEPEPYLRERAQINTGLNIMDAQLPLPPNLMNRNFDVVLLLDVLEHVQDDAAALRSAAKFLSKDGYLVINVPAMPWLWSAHDEVNQHYRRYVSDQLESLIRDADLVLSSTRYWGSFLAPLAYLGRRLQKKKTYKVSIPPAFLNKIMVKSVLAEYSIMTKINIPMGLSLMAVAQKNEIA